LAAALSITKTQSPSAGGVSFQRLCPEISPADLAWPMRGSNHQHAVIGGALQNPIGMVEIVRVGGAEIVEPVKRLFAVTVERPVEFVLDQVDDQGIEPPCDAIGQVELDLLAGQGRDERPGRIALD
jgi:hypothetical protein